MLFSTLFSNPLLFFAWIVAIVVAISVHEAAHAWAAAIQGDKTAKFLGRLTLNPFKHLDPWGTVLLLVAGFGWGKPVPFNPHNLRNSKWGPALVSVAGPASNLAMAILFALVLRFLAISTSFDASNGLIILVQALVEINIILAAFNLIPIPPLDGSKILFAVLPAKYDNLKRILEQYGFYILVGFILFGTVILSFLVGLLAMLVSVLVGFNVLGVFF